MDSQPHRVVFLAVDGFQSMDLFGPLDAFDAARELAGADYQIAIAGFAEGTVRTESGVPVGTDGRLDAFSRIGTLMLCGGRGARTDPLDETRVAALRAAADRATRVVSVCTGAFLLARTGLADGRRVATHWRYAADLARRHPGIGVDADSIFRRDGKFWSSAGVTAGIDLTLALIARDCGRPAAAAVARQLVVYLHRPGNQAQYSDPLSAQFRVTGRFGELLEWMTHHLSRPLTVEVLADRMAITPRHLTRLFREAFGQSPGRFVENLRLDRARLLLAENDARIEDVARRIGYNSDTAFRRAFERRFSMTPTQYRARFDTPETGNKPS